MLEESLDKNTKDKALYLLKGTLWAILAFMVPQLLAVLIVPLVDLLVGDTNIKIFVLQTFVQLSTVFLIWIFIYKTKIDFKKYIGLNKTKASNFLIAALAFPVYIVISILFSALVSVIFPVDLAQEQVIGFTTSTIFEMIIVFVALVIITPIAEELLFRGFLFKLYRSSFSPVASAIVVSLLFAIAHGQLNVALDTFILSLFLCYLRFTAKSLWPSVLLHSIKNFVAFYVLFIIGVK